MVPPLHVLIPEIERVAAKRVESPMLADLDAAELRDVLVRVVDTYQQRLSDPYNYLRVLSDEAQEKHSDLVEAREHLVEVRAKFLERLLEIVTPAVPSLLGPVTRERWLQKGSQARSEQHELLRGFELVDGKRRSSAGKITGRSWWIVALAPEDRGDEVTPRYACLEYTGEADDKQGTEHWTTSVQLCPPEWIADKIGESTRTKKKVEGMSWDPSAPHEAQRDPLEVLVDSVLGRLRAASSDKTATITQDTWASVERVEAALVVLRGTT